MHKKIIVLIILLVPIFYSCEDKKVNHISILMDVTDKIGISKPDLHKIIKHYYSEASVFDELKIKIATIDESQTSRSYSYTFMGGNFVFGNSYRREEERDSFLATIQRQIDTIYNQYTTRPKSKVFEKVVAEMESLSETKASTKHLFVFSNLYENSKVNAYSKNFQSKEINAIAKELIGNRDLDIDSSIEMTLIYEPNGYHDDNKYSRWVAIYKEIFKSTRITTLANL